MSNQKLRGGRESRCKDRLIHFCFQVQEWDLSEYIKRLNRDRFEPRIRLGRFGDFVLVHEEIVYQILVAQFK